MDRPIAAGTAAPADSHAQQPEQRRLIRQIEETFALLSSGQYTEAIKRASVLITQHAHEDRLYDILATAYIYINAFDAAIQICRKRLTAATSKKRHLTAQTLFRNSDMDRSSRPYSYPPLTWLQKYWTVLKAKAYAALYPQEENAVIKRLVRMLQTADDVNRFPQKHSQGLELRRSALADILHQLKHEGPEVIPYLVPLSVKYAWSGLFVPEILSVYPNECAARFLIDISMFGFAYASGACLHHLEKKGEAIIPYIIAAFRKEKKFDPIKTGLIAVLGNIRTPLAYRTLMDLIGHDNYHVINWAGDALGKFGNMEALPAMEAASKRIGNGAMIENAILHLKNLGNAE